MLVLQVGKITTSQQQYSSSNVLGDMNSVGKGYSPNVLKPFLLLISLRAKSSCRKFGKKLFPNMQTHSQTCQGQNQGQEGGGAEDKEVRQEEQIRGRQGRPHEEGQHRFFLFGKKREA